MTTPHGLFQQAFAKALVLANRRAEPRDAGACERNPPSPCIATP